MYAKILSYRTITAVLGVACSLALTACGGGGGGSAPQAVSVKAKRAVGVVHGTAAAPTLAGKPLVVTGAVTVNGKPAAASAIKPGVVVRGQETPGTAGTITVASADVKIDVEGPISAIDTTAGTIQVLSQTVTVDALTEIVQIAPDGQETSLTLKDLAVNDVVEVSGLPTSSGIQATRIERVPAGAPSADELSGAVASLDTTKMSFMIGSQLVDYSKATVTGTLANGAQVEVDGTLAGTTFAATAVRIDSEDAEDANEDMDFDGMVSALDTTAKTFQLGDKTIDYSGVSNLPTLSNGAEVTVQGTVDATNSNLVHATDITVEESHGGSGSADGEAAGPVTAIDTTKNVITVGNVSFWFDSQTVISKNDSQIMATDIMVGNTVEVKFDDTKSMNSMSYATKIEVETGAAATSNAVEGKVASFNAAGTTFVVEGITVQVTSTTTYESLDKTMTQADFFGTDRTGQQVSVAGTVSGSTITATRIELIAH